LIAYLTHRSSHPVPRDEHLADCQYLLPDRAVDISLRRSASRKRPSMPTTKVTGFPSASGDRPASHRARTCTDVTVITSGSGPAPPARTARPT